MAVQAMSNYGVKNCLLFAFHCLRNMDRLVGDSLQSPYELFHENLAKMLSRGKKIDYSMSNSEVEAFYLKRSSEIDFIASVQSKILCKMCSTATTSGANATTAVAGGPVTFSSILNFYGPIFSQVWDMVCETNSDICSKLPSVSGKHLWEIFLKLDTESELKVHIDDVIEVVLRIFKANGHNEAEETIKEWFSGEEVTFREFFSPLVEHFVGLLQVHTVTDVNRDIVNEFFKEGKLEKKGHVVHNWKIRWFVLTGASLTYYETHDKVIVKGSLVINGNAVVQNMPEYRARPHRFRVICGESKTVTEISAMDASTLQEWVYTIRMAIKMHQTPGRNFLHKLKQATSIKSSRKGVTHSTSMDKILAPPSHPPPVHRSLVAAMSVPDTRRSPDAEPEQRVATSVSPSLVSPTSSEDGTFSPRAFSSSASYTDAPPLPPQRFGSPDTKDLNSTQVFDKAALVEKRKNNQRKLDLRRHSSVEPDDIEHIVMQGEDYAIIKKSPQRKKKISKDISSLISPSVNAQLSVDATSQVERWSTEGVEEKNSRGVAKSRSMEKTPTSPVSKEPAPASPKKKISAEKQASATNVFHLTDNGLDYALIDSSTKKKKSKSPKPARKHQDAKPISSVSPRINLEKGKDDIDGSRSSNVSHVIDNGLDYAVIDTKSKKKSADTSSPSLVPSNPQLPPGDAMRNQNDRGPGKVHMRSESPEPRRGLVMSDKEKPGERKIEYSTVVFANSIIVPDPTEKEEKVRDFDRTKFDYSTVVFQAVKDEDKKQGGEASSSSPSTAAPVKRSIYDSDEDLEAAENPYVNVRRDGWQINTARHMNTPPVVPPRRGAAAIPEETSGHHAQ